MPDSFIPFLQAYICNYVCAVKACVKRLIKDSPTRSFFFLKNANSLCYFSPLFDTSQFSFQCLIVRKSDCVSCLVFVNLSLLQRTKDGNYDGGLVQGVVAGWRRSTTAVSGDHRLGRHDVYAVWASRLQPTTRRACRQGTRGIPQPDYARVSFINTSLHIAILSCN